MLTYVKYFVTWLFFMAIIAGITLIVPKLAKRIDKWRADKKAQMEREEALLQPPEEKPSDEAQNISSKGENN